MRLHSSARAEVPLRSRRSLRFSVHGLLTREWVEPSQVRGMSAVLGCWLALELRGHRLAGYTAGMLFALLTVASLILVIVWETSEETLRSCPSPSITLLHLVLARRMALLVDAAD